MVSLAHSVHWHRIASKRFKHGILWGSKCRSSSAGPSTAHLRLVQVPVTALAQNRVTHPVLKLIFGWGATEEKEEEKERAAEASEVKELL